ncbi:MAG: hypothetical protein UX87_C0002G0052 [Candidatus Amesbacteria bacterium GW2011_GWA1_47_16]|uniref:Uncharacterized protein n=5 Tax=Candidatus Amesiibacteriota TaxID=1752730 RepID=A0A1F4ZTQ2_9BACT|nr:MAG: hypothetical protein UX87_C0002G0052 [Candidatus Amesbacteria bacterium GW2011_GWA1_47_16]KKU65149.1 MAG: hypothetical protein UX86_C0001G0005 [Candidatus Amesbacteria bacterium GW2011_GWC1_47_15]KKU98491.1 MAG: hypothetical protein UY28_C0001G0041 [Candidatus Amesbacteria bacterium GW2011_GWB1_48_13]OGD00294.1 MAG: hypothetical protein A2972_00605 [Candidatus Amesbacteria bacterium RIFCSPLOWO2_01_FULL_47_33]OGD00866.1 MAG: hypothetical protein A2701_00445 [Candidatus Amesbacteria bacte
MTEAIKQEFIKSANGFFETAGSDIYSRILASKGLGNLGENAQFRAALNPAELSDVELEEVLSCIRATISKLYPSL